DILILAVLFALGLFGVIVIAVPGPYLEVLLGAYLLLGTEIVLMLFPEPHEDSVSNIFLTMAMYFTYCQFWPLVVANAFWKEFVRGEKRTWAKTRRFAQSRGTSNE